MRFQWAEIDRAALCFSSHSRFGPRFQVPMPHSQALVPSWMLKELASAMDCFISS